MEGYDRQGPKGSSRGSLLVALESFKVEHIECENTWFPGLATMEEPRVNGWKFDVLHEDLKTFWKH